MVCPRCSRQLPEGLNFCDNCGLALNNVQQKNTVQQPYNSVNHVPYQHTVYPPNAYVYVPVTQTSAPAGIGLGVTSMVLGILSLLLGWIPIFGYILATLLSIISIILGAVGISQARKTGDSNGMAIAGIVMSVLYLTFGFFVSFITTGLIFAY